MLKRLAIDLLMRADAFAVFRFLNRRKVPILMYHRFSEDGRDGSISASALRQQLAYLKKNYDILRLEEFAEMMRAGKPVPPRSAVVTIDDGYRDAYEIALPIFAEMEVPATLFVVTDFVDGKSWIWTDIARFLMLRAENGDLAVEINGKTINASLNGRSSRIGMAGKINSELKKLPPAGRDSVLDDIAAGLGVDIPALPPSEFAAIDWDQAVEMDKSWIAIGSHTVSHPILTHVTVDRLAEELSASRSVLSEKLGRVVDSFCYPNGDASTREFEATASAGYSVAVTTELRLSEPLDNKVALPRIDAEPEMHRFVQAVTGFDSIK
jgi:peptidoglycan/xylan/chitin deacetylase (PgdA/CDA1 family)